MRHLLICILLAGCVSEVRFERYRVIHMKTLDLPFSMPAPSVTIIEVYRSEQAYLDGEEPIETHFRTSDEREFEFDPGGPQQ